MNKVVQVNVSNLGASYFYLRKFVFQKQVGNFWGLTKVWLFLWLASMLPVRLCVLDKGAYNVLVPWCIECRDVKLWSHL